MNLADKHMNPIKENQKIKIIPDKINRISTGVVIKSGTDFFVAEINNSSFVSQGLEPEILISFDDYMVMFTSKIFKIEQNKVFFSVPLRFTFVQKREYPRVAANIPVLIKDSAGQSETEGVVKNIGGGGMQVFSPIKFKLNSILNVSFNLSGRNKINTSFEVLRVTDCTEDSDYSSEFFAGFNNKDFIISGRFREISNFDKISIVQFCFKHQLELNCKKR